MYSQSFDGYEKLFIVGDKVNVRDKSSLKSKVIFQLNWGDEVHAKKVNEEWYKFMSFDESSIYFIHSSYIKNKEAFIKLAMKREDRNSKTDLLLLQHFIDKEEFESALRISVKLINKLPEETILTGFEKCELVSYSALRKMTSSKLDIEKRQFIRKRLKSKVTNLTILNLLELGEIEELIRNKEYDLSNDKLNKILVKSSDNLFIEIACDYDLDSKVYPQVWFKNLYFINYQLSSRDKKNDIVRYLRKVRDDESINKRSRNMALDIYNKLFSLWKID